MSRIEFLIKKLWYSKLNYNVALVSWLLTLLSHMRKNHVS